MQILYKSTRGKEQAVTASMAILKGLSEDGGLFVPERIPQLDVPMDKLAQMTYQETAYEVMSRFLTDFTEEELKNCISKAYDSKFDTEKIAPLHESCGAYFLELFHGATIAFKDMALSILPHLMTTAAKKNHVKNEIVILTATSGDTGKAAMAGFADVPGTKIIVFYPKHGVSPIQEKQMVTQKGANTYVVGITGNFDDAQTAVKKMFNDHEMAAELDQAGFQFSSANSINIGRLVPQIVYYVYAYATLVRDGKIKDGQEINVVVPTGNFGNILAAYYAKQMGLPIHKLICASNENRVLYDFFRTGTYDRKRDFILTTSPSMDILISSNLERLIYRLTGENAEKCAELMKSLSEGGEYTITEEMKAQLGDFYGNFCSEEETANTISEIYKDSNYVIDTHTAVAAGVYKKYVSETDDHLPTVIASTASPYKFTRSVMDALGEDHKDLDDFGLVDALSALSKVPVPRAVEEIRTAPVLHDKVVDAVDMPAAVKEILNIK
ncbi:threonine synthase [Ruminococcus sp. AM36-2AA]|nr:threonine synthase [Ruminococcus sp. AM36-5]RGH54411.1 threonine synthase [Ruminococcus sp. AM36-2AA]